MGTRIAAKIEHYLFEHEDRSLPEFTVLSFSGQEGISQLTHFEIDLLCSEQEKNVDFSKVLDRRAALRIWNWQDSNYGRVYHGIISSFEQIDQGEKHAVFRAQLVPLLWRLTLNYQSRIFQDKSVPDIIEDVLKGAGLQSSDYRMSLKGKYEPLNKPPSEFCVQYCESDFNFISRLMEKEGIFYFFEYGDDKEVLVIADDASVHEDATPTNEIRYVEPTELQPLEEEYIFPIRYKESVLPTKVTLKDFNHDTPQTNLFASSQIQKGGLPLVYEYPGGFGFLNRGTDLAKIRNQEIEAGRKLASGGSNCRSLCAGYCFTLTGYPRDELNRKYLLTRVSHYGTQGGPLAQDVETKYENQFECIPADTPYRPTRVTPKPVVQGAQTAIVVGPENEEIYVDEKGRVKVQFHWDLQGEYDEKSSCWVRVRQTWAGAGWGGMFIPRVGHEVVIDFLEGDPDKPIIIGEVYNGINQMPYKLPADKTKSTIKTNSSKGGQGFNEIRFEDKKGSEEIFIHAEKNMDVRVKSDRREYVGNDRHLAIERDKIDDVKRDKQVIIRRDEVREIRRDHNLTIKGKEAVKVDQSRSITVQGDVIEAFKANQSTQVTQDYYLKAMNVVIEAMTGLTIKAGSNFITLNSSGIYISGSMVNINSGGSALSGSAGSPVTPPAPLEAQIAGTASPGVDQTPWHREPTEEEEAAQTAAAEEEGQEKTWIEIELVDENDQPIAGERYEMTLPDGTTVATGTTGPDGVAKVRWIDPGNCQITFPNLDKDAWEKI